MMTFPQFGRRLSFWQRARAIFNLNDPHWGRNGNQGDGSDSGKRESSGQNANQNPEGGPGRRPDGPPDLDDLWRDFSRKLGGLFGNGRGDNGNNTGGNGNGRPPQPPFRPSMKSAGASAGVVVVIAVLVWLGSGFFIVQEGQQAAVLTFGRYSHTVDAGFQWHLPYPFQTQETVSVSQLRTVDVGTGAMVSATGLRDSSMLTQDENIVDIRFTVQYRIKSVSDYLFQNADPDGAVVQASESAVRETVGRSAMDAVLYEQRDAIAAALVKSIQEQLDRLGAGVVITNVNIQSVQAPEQVQAAFDDALKASADRERLKNEGQAYANDVIPRAQGTASRLREEAEGYKARVIAQAEGDADRFNQIYEQYRKSPAVTRERMYIDTMQQVYSNVTKILVDTRNNSLLYLPLDKILQQTGGGAPQPAAGTSSGNASTGDAGASRDTAPRQSAPAASFDERNSLRSRDRDAADIR